MVQKFNKITENKMKKITENKMKKITELKAKSVPDKHREKIALKTLKMNSAIGNMLGGMDKDEAIDFLKSLGYTDAQLKKLSESKVKQILKKMIKEELKSILSEAKYRAEVTGIGENTWSTNAKTFNTPEEAKKWLDQLSQKWFGYDMGRVVDASTPLRQKVNLKKDNIYQNFRK